jgi:tRNA threonylcarbamoyl adenosine modification protein (Sua5/YciO/YrdC/YwlC family)
MLLKLYRENPNERHVERIVSVLKDGGLIIYPTDGVYAYGCSLHSPKAVDKLKAITGKDKKEFSIMCSDLSHISDYVKVDNTDFKILKRNLPGPFTFVMRASSSVPDRVLAKRKTIGIRIADNPITLAIVGALGAPLVTSSVKNNNQYQEYTTDPELIAERWGNVVDIVVDGGPGELVPTTLVDLTGDEPEILREGGGELAL